eukprot:scaffold2183_cov131-Cylindrotheca_fusiformis.AAC.3
MKKYKKTKVSMPTYDVVEEDEEEDEEHSDDDESQTAEAAATSDSFSRQGNQCPPTRPTPSQQEIGDNRPNQMDETALLRAELRRLQEENDKMKSNLSTPSQETVHTTLVTPAKNLTRGGGGLTALQHMNSSQEAAMRNFATKFVFPKSKFIQTDLMARQYCILAVANNDVALSTSATVEQFAEMYHNTLEKRVRQIRLNSNTGARVKFIGKFSSRNYSLQQVDSEKQLPFKKADLKQGRVPEGFSYETLTDDGYCDLLSEFIRTLELYNSTREIISM